MTPAVNIFGRHFPEVYVVDAFAGQGRFDDGAPQSSLFAARVAQERHLAGKTILRCINVERCANTYERLTDVTSQAAPGLVTNLLGTFEQHFATIMTQLGRSPAIFILDPFDVAPIPWRLVNQLARRRYTDVLLTFMGRDAGLRAGLSRRHGFAATYANTSLITELTGGDAWQSLTAEARTGQLRTVLTDHYLSRLASSCEYAFDYDIREANGRYKYTLMFMTGDPAPLRIINDLFYDADRAQDEASQKLRVRRRTPDNQFALPLDWSPTQADVDRLLQTELEQGMVTLLETSPQGRLVRRLQIDLWMRGWFGKAQNKHFNRALSSLIQGPRVTVVSGVGDMRQLILGS